MGCTLQTPLDTTPRSLLTISCSREPSRWASLLLWYVVLFWQGFRNRKLSPMFMKPLMRTTPVLWPRSSRLLHRLCSRHHWCPGLNLLQQAHWRKLRFRTKFNSRGVGQVLSQREKLYLYNPAEDGTQCKFALLKSE